MGTPPCQQFSFRYPIPKKLVVSIDCGRHRVRHSTPLSPKAIVVTICSAGKPTNCRLHPQRTLLATVQRNNDRGLTHQETAWIRASPPNPSIITERDGDVGVVTIDRQHVRNAVNPPALRQMAELITTWPNDGFRAIVITGAGTASFSSGMDLRAMRAIPQTEVSEAISTFDAAMNDDYRVPVIPAVNGSACGWGTSLDEGCRRTRHANIAITMEQMSQSS